jgi:hypothetical protein
MIRRKRGSNGVDTSAHHSSCNCLFTTIVAMTCCLLICVYISYHSYFQLGYESDSARLFINNKVYGFEKELDALMTTLDNPKQDTELIDGDPASITYFRRPPPTVLDAPPVHQLSCPHGELMTFWKPCTKSDINYVSPFKDYGPKDKYVTFEPGT